MSDFSQRQYYKLFTGGNQINGYDNIHLGYQGNTTEIVFQKDRTTFFHVPFFSTTQNISSTSLIADGAIPGPIPALSDRIFKKQGGYGNTTPWGETTQIQDGSWLCSWLYTLSSETPIWLDRYYNPGRLSIDEALEGTANILDYQKHDPVYYDVPSTMTLDAGVWYQFFHHGEKTAKENVKLFSGENQDKLRLYINTWGPDFTDNTIYKNRVFIENFKTDWVDTESALNYVDRSILTFENNNFINCVIPYSINHTLTDEFTVSFWVSNKNWNNASSAQLIGNYQQGGYGVFYKNLDTIPFFGIPETTYGHLYLFNQESNFYFEKNIQLQLNQRFNPVFVCQNSENEILLIDAVSERIFKYNHLGDIIAQSRESNNNLFTIIGTPQGMLLDKDNNLTVSTTSGTFIFDEDLIFKDFIFSQNEETNTFYQHNLNGEIEQNFDCIDAVYDNYNTKWLIDTDYSLYYNDQIYTNLAELSCTNVEIDPENNLWVLTSTNDVYKINTATKEIIATFKIGISTEDSVTYSKHITFVKSYDRTTNTFLWKGLLLRSFEKTLYTLQLDGTITGIVDLVKRLNILETATADQDPRQINFNFKGDITGYRWRRIFNRLAYNNKPQLQVKVYTDQPITKLPLKSFRISIPTDKFVSSLWHFVVCTYKNRELKLYVDNTLKQQVHIPNNYSLSYNFKNDLLIGTPNGKTETFNKETNTVTNIWNGKFDDFKIYDYAIDHKFLISFIREKYIGENVIWNIQTAPLQYIEAIDKFFKHRIPGHKSSFFKLKIHGHKIYDAKTRERIEQEIKTTLNNIKPNYTELLAIEWID
jgi:hypothetical protein